MSAEYISSILLENEINPKSYLCNLPAVNHLSCHSRLDFNADVTFFVGENGTGKSTLLEAVAVAYGFNPEGGNKNFTFSTNATHSPILMTFPNAQILEFSKNGIEKVNYSDTEHYKITKHFLGNPQKMLNYLLEDYH